MRVCVYVPRALHISRKLMHTYLSRSLALTCAHPPNLSPLSISYANTAKEGAEEKEAVEEEVTEEEVAEGQMVGTRTTAGA